jgi:hypothetical protein
VIQQNHENDCPPEGDGGWGKISQGFEMSSSGRQKNAGLEAQSPGAAKSGESFCEEFTLQNWEKGRKIVGILGMEGPV